MDSAERVTVARSMPTVDLPQPAERRRAYVPPGTFRDVRFADIVPPRRLPPLDQQKRLGFDAVERKAGLALYCVGEIELLMAPCVAVVGSRAASEPGTARARRLARELAEAGIVVVSGLAEGIDYAAHTAAIAAKGRTIAVIGTPLEKVYPAKHKRLQEQIYNEHLLVSQFPAGTRTFPSSFPARNKVMAALSDATVIVEAGEKSGALHQAAECLKLGRWLFIAASVMNNRELSWPAKFSEYPRCRTLSATSDILDVLRDL